MSKILVVDDDELDLREQAKFSGVNGATVTTAMSGHEAIEKIKAEDFEFVVTDLNMETPYAGLEVLRAAKDKDKFTEVILITGKRTQAISVLAMSLGAYDYIEKQKEYFEKGSSNKESLEKLRIQVGKALEDRSLKLAERGE
jgi:DNA-binding NtrC family response regulator